MGNFHAAMRPLPPIRRKERRGRVLGELGDYELLEEVGRGGQGRGISRRQKVSIDGRLKGYQPWSVGEQSAPEALSPRSGSGSSAWSIPVSFNHEVGERDGQCYFSMKFVEGGQLTKWSGARRYQFGRR